MKLVQINNKIERHFCGIVMTPFLSAMHGSYYIYLLYISLIFSQLFLTVNFRSRHFELENEIMTKPKRLS